MHNNLKRLLTLSTTAMLFAFNVPAYAGAITSYGAVTALTNISQMSNTDGFADFEGGGNIPVNTYSAMGLTLAANGTNFSSILPGIVSSGVASNVYSTNFSYLFPGPIGGGGSISGLNGAIGLVGTFSSFVTQVGATFSRNGAQFLTAWGTDGSLLGQVRWDPSSDASFVGIDTGSAAIAMIAYGNDDVFNGANYDVGGSTTIFDNMVWNGTPSVPEPLPLTLLGIGLAMLGFRKRVAKQR